ncbi:hypothetical protein V1293_003788 [Bradyrhizobium sp. AZCC 1693]
MLRAGDTGIGESRHPDVAGQRGARQQVAVAGFGRDVPGPAMIERACI